MAKPQCWTPFNPVKAVAMPRGKDKVARPKILTNAEAFRLLFEAQRFKGGRLFLFVVLGLVAGLRPTEAARIQARRKVLGQSSFRFSTVPESNLVDVVGKNRQDRSVEIPPEFISLIQVYVEAGYPVIPRNFTADWTQLRSLINYVGDRAALPESMFSEELKQWVRDILRKTGITHHISRSKDEEATSLWAGNTPRKIFTHYRKKTTPKNTTDFYNIAAALHQPTIEELRKNGVPEGALRSELMSMEVDPDDPDTFGLEEEDFKAARADYWKRCPEAAKPEPKGPRFRKAAFRKHEQLPLPKDQDELIKLVWTLRVIDLAKKYNVPRDCMSRAVNYRKPPMPWPGYWRQRGTGKDVYSRLPTEVKKLFPDGLPPYSGPGWADLEIDWPPLTDFLNMLWLHSRTVIRRKNWAPLAPQSRVTLRCRSLPP